MEDHRLKAFCLVVELRSFSKAAEAKFMTQSAMSHLIKNLEDRIGARLLIRQGKTVAPTPAGKKFYEHARKILDQYKIMKEEIYGFTRKIEGPLSVGASMTAAKYLLPQVFYEFSKIHSEVKINLSVSNTEKIAEELVHGDIDIGIVEGNTVKDKAVVMEEIAKDEIVLIASEDNPLCKKRQAFPEDLLSQPFIMPEPGSGTREIINDFLNSTKLGAGKMKILMTLGDPDLLVQMVQSGVGIAFVSKWSAFRAVKEGTVKILKISGKRLHRRFHVIALDNGPSTMVARTFFEFVKGHRFFVPL